MNLHMLKSLVIAMLLAVSGGTATAGCNTERCTGVGTEAFTSLFLAEDGRILIGGPAERGNLTCTLAEGNYMTLRPDHLQFKQIYSTLLFAMQSGSSVNIRISQNTSDCKVVYVVIYV
jgi:predicted small secreted protein